MRPSEFFRHLEQSSPAPVYLFRGDADFLMEEAWNRLVERIVPIKARRFNGERLSAKEHSATEVLARLSVLPMFGPKQLIMVQRIEAWLKDQQKIIHSYVLQPYPTACLVLTATQKKGTEKLESAVGSVGIVVHFPSPTEREAPRWVQERARCHRKQLSSQAASLLLEQVGLDLHRLERELEKLAAYVGGREKIELEDVKQAVSPQRSFSVFELLRYVSRREAGQAVFSLRRLILSGEAPLGILALLSRQIRILWQIKDAANRGLTIAQMGQRLNLPPFVVKSHAEEAPLFSEAELYRIHQALRETDLALKGTGTAPEVILEALVLRLCLKR